jgi:hypoxanthine phosphoribosyltransferase
LTAGSRTVLDAVAARRAARRIHSARDVSRALTRMAKEIGARLAGTDPVVLAVMQGGVFAAVELSKRFRFPHEFDYVHVTRYAGGTRGGAIEWRVRPGAALAGRTVLIVDDVLDRGHTLHALQRDLRRIGVAAQYTAVLVAKRVKAKRRPRVDFAGLEVDDVYVFGCGMDYRGYWRGLRALYALAEDRGR